MATKRTTMSISEGIENGYSIYHVEWFEQMQDRSCLLLAKTPEDILEKIKDAKINLMAASNHSTILPFV